MNSMGDLPGMLQHMIHRYHRNTMQTYMADAGVGDIGSPMLLLTLHEWHTTHQRHPSQRELAEALHITPATVAMSLKSLEQGGYIEKKADLTDQRCKRIAITEKGSEMALICVKLYAKVRETMRAGMTDEECQCLDRLNMRMVNNMRVAVGEPPLEEGWMTNQ